MAPWARIAAWESLPKRVRRIHRQKGLTPQTLSCVISPVPFGREPDLFQSSLGGNCFPAIGCSDDRHFRSRIFTERHGFASTFRNQNLINKTITAESLSNDHDGADSSRHSVSSGIRQRRPAPVLPTFSLHKAICGAY